MVKNWEVKKQCINGTEQILVEAQRLKGTGLRWMWQSLKEMRGKFFLIKRVVGDWNAVLEVVMKADTIV